MAPSVKKAAPDGCESRCNRVRLGQSRELAIRYRFCGLPGSLSPCLSVPEPASPLNARTLDSASRSSVSGQKAPRGIEWSKIAVTGHVYGLPTVPSTFLRGNPSVNPELPDTCMLSNRVIKSPTTGESKLTAES